MLEFCSFYGFSFSFLFFFFFCDRKYTQSGMHLWALNWVFLCPRKCMPDCLCVCVGGCVACLGEWHISMCVCGGGCVAYQWGRWHVSVGDLTLVPTWFSYVWREGETEWKPVLRPNPGLLERQPLLVLCWGWYKLHCSNHIHDGPCRCWCYQYPCLYVTATPPCDCRMHRCGYRTRTWCGRVRLCSRTTSTGSSRSRSSTTARMR